MSMPSEIPGLTAMERAQLPTTPELRHVIRRGLMAVWRVQGPESPAARRELLRRMMRALSLAQGDISHAVDVLQRADAGDADAQAIVARVLLSVANIQGQST